MAWGPWSPRILQSSPDQGPQVTPTRNQGLPRCLVLWGSGNQPFQKSTQTASRAESRGSPSPCPAPPGIVRQQPQRVRDPCPCGLLWPAPPSPPKRATRAGINKCQTTKRKKRCGWACIWKVPLLRWVTHMAGKLVLVVCGRTQLLVPWVSPQAA